jgi:hypothetical protein
VSFHSGALEGGGVIAEDGDFLERVSALLLVTDSLK